MSLDLLTLEFIRQLASIIYSIAMVLASFLFPLAMLHGIKAYCAAFGTRRLPERKKQDPKQANGDASN